MDQIHNHFTDSTIVQGANFQSHFIPAEKPYAVYSITWDGPTASIAQHIGTMLVGTVNDEGKLLFEGKAVYRMPGKQMLDFEHCFIPDDMGELVGDPYQLGFVGDTVGKEELVNVAWRALREAEYDNVDSLLENMQMAGLKVNLDKEYKIQDVKGFFDREYNNKKKKNDYFLCVNEEIAIRVKVWNSDGKSETAYRIITTLRKQMKKWQGLKVSFERIVMKDSNEFYQKQVDELLEMAKIFDKYEKLDTKDYLLYYLFDCRDIIGTGRFFYEDYKKAMKKLHLSSYSNYDKDLQWAIDAGLVTREGNIIQLSPEVERIASWKWEWKPDEKII